MSVTSRPGESVAPRARPIVAQLGDGWKRCADPAWLAGWEPVSLALEGGVTHVVAMGEGPALVLIPPLPGIKEAWVACARPLARRFRVVTFDLRTRFDGRPRWDVLLGDLERVLDAFAPGAIAVAGHSLGGALAQRWALARPERVRALVLSSTFARLTDPPGNRWARYVEQPLVLAGQRWLSRPAALALARRLARREAWVYDRRCDEHILDFVRFCIRDLPLADVRAPLRLAWDHDARGTLSAIRCPTLLVAGERESVFVREAAAELERLILGARLAVSPGVGHLHPLSGAAWLVETMSAWLTAQLPG